MNNNQITMAYRMKYLTLGLILYPVVLYAWKAYQNNNSKETLIG